MLTDEGLKKLKRKNFLFRLGRSTLIIGASLLILWGAFFVTDYIRAVNMQTPIFALPYSYFPDNGLKKGVKEYRGLGYKINRYISGTTNNFGETLLLDIVPWNNSYEEGNKKYEPTVIEIAKSYAKEKYNIDIVVENIAFDDYGVNYHLNVYPQNDKELKFRLFTEHDFKSISEDTLASDLWGRDLKMIIGKDIEKAFNCDYSDYNVAFFLAQESGYELQPVDSIEDIPSYTDVWNTYFTSFDGAGCISIDLSSEYESGITEQRILEFAKSAKNKVTTPNGAENLFMIYFERSENGDDYGFYGDISELETVEDVKKYISYHNINEKLKEDKSPENNVEKTARHLV